jgi:predicted ABC-type transport system involved in lysophospholipase L1 biosynthesis ATPase subunit
MRPAVPRALAALSLALLFIGAILQVDWPTGDMDQTTSREVAQTLFGYSNLAGYGLIMMLIGLLLLVALLGGVFLAKEERP